MHPFSWPVDNLFFISFLIDPDQSIRLRRIDLRRVSQHAGVGSGEDVNHRPAQTRDSVDSADDRCIGPDSQRVGWIEGRGEQFAIPRKDQVTALDIARARCMLLEDLP